MFAFSLKTVLYEPFPSPIKRIARSIKRLLTFNFPALRHILFRKALVEYNFFSETTTWKECISVLWAILRGEPLADGPWIKRYEKEFAKYLGVKHAFSFATGRMGLYAILEALDIGEGDEVILPAFTCIVVPNAIIYRRAKPVYVDIDASTFNIDVAKIEERITSRTKAILAQHTFGLCCDMEKILEIASKYGIEVIEDCAHALGAAYKGKKAGTLGKASFFSTDHTKIMSTSFGGMVVTDDDVLARRLSQIQAETPFFERKKILRIIFNLVSENLFAHPSFYFIGKFLRQWLFRHNLTDFILDDEGPKKPTAYYAYPARLSNIQSKVGLSQLRDLENNLARRRETAQMYDAILNIYPHLLNSSEDKHVFLRYVFLVEDRQAWRKLFRKYLELGDWFCSVAYGKNANLHEIGYTIGSCPVAEWVIQHCVNLPTHPKTRNPKQIIRILKGALNSDDAAYVTTPGATLFQ